MYKIKLEFKIGSSGQWEDWSNYIINEPVIHRRVESKNPGEPGLITFDRVALSLYYVSGNVVSYYFNPHEGPLTLPTIYYVRLSNYLSSSQGYIKTIEGIVDFSTVSWEEGSNVVQFDVIDSISALALLRQGGPRVRNTLYNKLTEYDADILEYYPFENTIFLRLYKSGTPGHAVNLEDIILAPGEIIYLPCVSFSPALLIDFINYERYLVIDSQLVNFAGASCNFIRVAGRVDSHEDGGRSIYLSTSQQLECIDPIFLDKEIFGYNIYNTSFGIPIINMIGAIIDYQLPIYNPFNYNGIIPPEQATMITDTALWDKNALDCLKMLASTINCYLYTNKDGELVIYPKDKIIQGTIRSIPQLCESKLDYIWNKLIDKVEVRAKSWLYNIKEKKNLEGYAVVTNGCINSRNNMSVDCLVLDSNLVTQDDLNNYALTKAIEYYNFYGKRRFAYKLVFQAIDDIYGWELVDLLSINGELFFFTSIKISGGQVSIEAIGLKTYEYSENSLVPITSLETKLSKAAATTISYIGGGTSTANYNYMAPLELIGGQVRLNFISNLRLNNDALDTIQDIATTSTPTFAQLILSNAGTTSTQAVRADRQVFASAPLTGGGNLTADRTISLLYNTTNLKLTSNALNTIQDIGTSSSPLFSDLTLSGKLNLTAGTSNVNSVAWGTELYLFRSGPNELRLTGGALRIFRSTNPALILGDNGSGSSIMNITAIAGQVIDIRLQTSNSQRWIIRRTGDAESGNNAGSNFHLNRYNDSGVLIDTVLSVARNTGNVGIGSNLYAANEKLEVAGNIHVSGGDRTIYNRSNNYLALGTNNVERIRILPNGNVAIGTTGAPERLTIAGNTHLAGHIFCFGDEVNSFWGNVEHVGNKAFYNDFTSGWTGSGWRLGYDLDAEQERVSYANLELDNLWVRGSMTVYELIINQIRATNGSLFVTSSARVDTTSSDTSYNIRIFFEDPEGHNLCPFLVDDILLMQRVRLDSTTLVKRVALRVMSVSGRSIEANYIGFTPLEPPQKGELYVRIGNYNNSSRRGSIYLTSDDSNAPYMDVIDEVAQWSDWGNSNKLKVRLGRLSGMNDSYFGNLSGYGLYAKSNAYLRGKIYAEQGGWIAGWSINAADLTSPAVTVAGKNNLFRLNANQSTGLIGAHLLLDTSAIDVPGYLSFGRVLSGTGTSENKVGIAYKQGTSTFFELTDSDKSIAGWNFDNNRLFKDSVTFESSASMKGLVVDTDKIKIGSFTFGEMSNSLTDITYTLLNGYTGISVSDIYWGIIGNYWDMYNRIEDVGKEQYNNLIRCVIGTEASSWDYRLVHNLFQANVKVLGKQIKVEFKLEFSPYPDYMEDGGSYQVAIRYYDELWNTIYRQVILEGTVNNGLTTQTIDKTGANGITVMVPASIPNIQYVYIEWGFYGGAQSGTFYPKTMELSNVKFYGYEGFRCWLNETGLYLYNSPNNHIKLFADYGEINIPLVKVRGKSLVRFHGRLSVPPVSDVELGDMYININNNKIYQCYDINNLGVPQWSLLN